MPTDRMTPNRLKYRDGEQTNICGDCNGSGEGYAPGTKCPTCRGWGEVSYASHQTPLDDFNEPEDD